MAIPNVDITIFPDVELTSIMKKYKTIDQADIEALVTKYSIACEGYVGMFIPLTDFARIDDTSWLVLKENYVHKEPVQVNNGAMQIPAAPNVYNTVYLFELSKPIEIVSPIEYKVIDKIPNEWFGY